MKYRIDFEFRVDTEKIANTIKNNIETLDDYKNAWELERGIKVFQELHKEDKWLVCGKILWNNKINRDRIITWLKDNVKQYLLAGSRVRIHLCSHDNKNIKACHMKELVL